MSTPADNRAERYQITRAIWRGITLEIRHCPMWSKIAEIDHIEVVSKDRQVLPITETGYRSLFIKPEYIEAYGSARAYVLGWLDCQSALNFDPLSASNVDPLELSRPGAA